MERDSKDDRMIVKESGNDGRVTLNVIYSMLVLVRKIKYCSITLKKSFSIPNCLVKKKREF